MNRIFASRFCTIAAMIFALFTFIGLSGDALAQCEGPACPDGYLIDPDPDIECDAPITRFRCNGGANFLPTFSPYTGAGGMVLEPCVCDPVGLAGIVVNGTFIAVGTGACIDVGDCNLAYDVQVDENGCIRVKITNC